MARKNNIRSMRFSDDVIEMIESQQGRNFSEKFENLVTRCMWELPEKERRIAELDKDIKEKCDIIRDLQDKYLRLSRTLKLTSDYADQIGKSLFIEVRNM